MRIALRILGVLLILAGLGLVGAWFATEKKPARLTWDNPVVRDSLMSFGYNVYANPQVADGRYYLSKLVLKNEGGKPVRDLRISYQIPGYISWTTPDVVPQLPGGTSVVKLYYPKLPDSIARLANETTCTLEIRMTWNEEGVGAKEETLRDNFVIRGMNEMQYSDLPHDEMVTWYDQWTLSPFLACMVTPNDPVVKEYAAAINERLGGTMASVRNSPEDVAELMKATYEYMCETGMRYTGAKGVPEEIGNVRTLVQTIRLPRDVITSNTGLCIELAILWSSILDHLGVNSYVLMRPGHAFTIVEIAGQQIPIECTAITPKAVGQSQFVPFEEAVKMASKDLQEQQFKFPLGVQELHSKGYTPPELPDIDLEKIKKILTDRKQQAAPPPQQVYAQQQPAAGGDEAWGDQGGGMPAPAAAGTGEQLTSFTHRAGLLSFQYPATWTAVSPMTQLGVTFSAGDLQSGMSVSVFEIPNVRTVDDALAMLYEAFSNFGLQAQIDQSRQKNGMTLLGGTTYSNATPPFTWVGVFKPVKGGVIGITMGSPSSNFQAAQPALMQYISTVRIP
jgi:hypothetical protein